MSQSKMYTQEQLEIEIIKNSHEGIIRAISEIKLELKSQCHFIRGLLLGLYAAVGSLALTKLLGGI